MPELPEVETVVRDLNKFILGGIITRIWTDAQKIIKKPKSFKNFEKEIKGRKIEKIRRRGKNVIFELSGGKTLLVHQKMTGHLLFGKWKMENGKWATTKGPLQDPQNRFIHLMFWLDKGKMLALSDLRKFAKVELLDDKELKKELSSLGPEPLEKSFTLDEFKKVLKNKKGKIKQVLMNQAIIAGIGNIYSDEILWQAKVHPFKDVSKLLISEINKIYQAMREVLTKAVKLGGTSISDFRRPSGEKGLYSEVRKVYRLENKECGRCEGTLIKRMKIGGRSAHFCPVCQKL